MKRIVYLLFCLLMGVAAMHLFPTNKPGVVTAVSEHDPVGGLTDGIDAGNLVIRNEIIVPFCAYSGIQRSPAHDKASDRFRWADDSVLPAGFVVVR